MASLLTRVKTKMTIYAHRKVQGLLEGEYGSVFKGRSMDFDDLRPYVPGDDIKDIDWKATARSGQTLVKRYVAIRKHNILLVVDTGRNMAATGASGTSKRDIAVMASGVLGYIAEKHGDLVALVAGDQASTHYLPLKGTTEHLERILRYIDQRATLQAAPSDLARQLHYVARSISRRMMLIIVADDLALSTEHEQLLRRLTSQHEVMWVTIGDADLTARSWLETELYDVAGHAALPAFVRRNDAVRQEFSAATIVRRTDMQKLLDRLGISSQRVTDEASVISGLFRLLEKQKYAKHK